MECIGGKIFSIGYDVLVLQGRMIVYGLVCYVFVGNWLNYLCLLYYFFIWFKFDFQKMFEYNKSIMGFNFIWLYERVVLMYQLFDELKSLDLGCLIVGEWFVFEDLYGVILCFQFGQMVGKFVVEL